MLGVCGLRRITVGKGRWQGRLDQAESGGGVQLEVQNFLHWSTRTLGWSTSAGMLANFSA